MTDVVTTEDGRGGAVRSEHPAVAEDRARHEATLAAGAKGWHPDQPSPDLVDKATGELTGFEVPAEFAGAVKPDDPVLASARGAALQAGIRPDQFAMLAAAVLGRAKQHAPAPVDEAAHVAAETAKLGAEGPAMLRDLAAWGSELKASGVIADAAEFAEYRYFAGSAAGARLLAKLMKLARKS